MKVSVIGSGGREHALRFAIARTAELVSEHALRFAIARTAELVSEPTESDLVVIGPEAPLVDGTADVLRLKGLDVYGPGVEGAQLENSKQFMKDFVARAGVPTAKYRAVTTVDEAREFIDSLNGGYVIKTDGLAAGKGVLVTTSRDEAIADVSAKLSGESFGEAGRKVVLEEMMTGPEVSVMFVFDGKRGLALPPAQDFKRALDHDQGPNTGGMGAYSPVPLLDAAMMESIHQLILHPTAEQLQREGIDYRGTLYAGLMITQDGPKLVEYNVRFGDPETQVIVPRLQGDIAGLLASAARGSLDESLITTSSDCAVTVTLASAGYPQSSRKGDRIMGIAQANAIDGVQVYEAGVKRVGDDVVTDGGRVLNVSALAPTLGEARALAYQGVGKISFDGMQFRKDIALSAANVPSNSEPNQ